MRRRTKIICTIGPAVDSLEQILQLVDAGMNVARLNFSHGTHEEQQRRIDLLKKAREMRKRPLAIMMDTKGPEIRVGVIKEPIPLIEKQKLKLKTDTRNVPNVALANGEYLAHSSHLYKVGDGSDYHHARGSQWPTDSGAGTHHQKGRHVKNGHVRVLVHRLKVSSLVVFCLFSHLSTFL